MSWHVLVLERIIKDSSGEPVIEITVIITILDENNSQDAQTTYGITMACLKVFKESHPDVKSVWIRSDQAGCYKGHS